MGVLGLCLSESGLVVISLVRNGSENVQDGIRANPDIIMLEMAFIIVVTIN